MPRRSAPVVTVALVLTNLLVYLHEIVLGGQGSCEVYGLIPTRLTPETFFTYGFFHDPENIFHLLGNLAFLAVFGFLVEGALGHLRFAAFYVAAGVFGGLLHVLVDPSSTTPLVGASGSIFGVLAVAAILRPSLLVFVVTFAGIEVGRAFLGDGNDVSFGCHLGGLCGGVLIAATMRAVGSETLEAA